MMSNLQGQAGETGKLYSPALILDSLNYDDDESILNGQEGRPGEQGQLDSVESIEAKQLRERTGSYLVAKSSRTSSRVASLAKPSGPIQFVIQLLENWRLEKSDAVKLLGFAAEETEYVHRLLQGEEQLNGRDIKERIGHLFHIRGTLRALFQDLKTENDWLREEHSLLDKKSPLDILLEGSMESLLLVREYVDTVAGM